MIQSHLRHSPAARVALVLVCLAARPAVAQTPPTPGYNWNAFGGGLWSVGNNWVPTGPPPSGIDQVLGFGSSRLQTASPMNVARLVRDGLIRNQLFLGSENAAVRDFHDAIAHLRQMHAARPKAVEAIITARIGPDDALWHFEHRQPQGIKTVVSYE